MDRFFPTVADRLPVSPGAAHLSDSLFVTMELGVCPPPSTGSFPSCLLPSTSSRSCQQVKQIWGSQCLYFGPQNRKYTVGHRGHGEPTGILGNGGQARGCTTHHRRVRQSQGPAGKVGGEGSISAAFPLALLHFLAWSIERVTT